MGITAQGGSPNFHAAELPVPGSAPLLNFKGGSSLGAVDPTDFDDFRFEYFRCSFDPDGFFACAENWCPFVASRSWCEGASHEGFFSGGWSACLGCPDSLSPISLVLASLLSVSIEPGMPAGCSTVDAGVVLLLSCSTGSKTRFESVSLNTGLASAFDGLDAAPSGPISVSDSGGICGLD